MNASCQLLLGFGLLQLLAVGSYADRISINGSENQSRLTWKRIATVCMKRDLFITYRILYNADRGCCPKILMYSDKQYQEMVYNKFLEMTDRGQEMQKEDIVKSLYMKGSSEMDQVERSLEGSYFCSRVNREQLKVLDPSQVVNLCPTSGISIGSHGKSYRSCTGGVKLTEQVSLPNRTVEESWYVTKNNQSVDANEEKWVENTWHFALTNCPREGPLRISYHIIIDSVNNLGTTVKDKSYENPMLESRCPRTAFPSELESLRNALHGGCQRMTNSIGTISFCILFFCKFFSS